MKITFHGAARTVTGSKHLLTTTNGVQILLDCGLFQGMGAEGGEYNRHFGFNPAAIDYVILSHAHIDHSGLLPRLVREGFKGEIYCTPPTRDLCELMLLDSGSIQESDIEYVNKKRKRKDLPPLEPLYTELDAEKCLKYFKEVDYHVWKKIGEDISFCFTDSGHVLGSAAVSLVIKENGVEKRLFFSGDIGRPGDQILRKPEPFQQADFIICESTYGDRLHEPVVNAEEHLLKTVIETCVENKGKLIIPAFSLDRTQELIYTLDRMEHEGKLPPIKVFVDSPLSVQTTRIVEKHIECFNAEIREYMKTGDRQPFFFKNLHFITDVEDSKALNKLKEPCIIISASGMAEAGRIKHHIKNNISSGKNTILIVGYCTPHSLGGRLAAGEKVVRIFGEDYDVNARIEEIDAYSAHADYQEMIGYLKCQDISKVKRLFMVHGDYPVMVNFKSKLNEAGFKDIYIPEKGESVEI
ncbi:MAG TPA: MBL fold metallo-hydrolase [Bacteroidia bacterium]|nr:MBL fold metallo-hydrolase [Bacteroidia bacterium]